MSTKVRVRFAPSPTGHLHIGGARTALFNFLFARRHGGTFVLRIEDTDQERSTPESAAGIIEALRWLGLDYDEGPGKEGDFGPYYQSERRPLYSEAAEKLLAQGRAYRCYCSPDDLTRRREEARASKEGQGYDGRCRNLTEEEKGKFEKDGTPSAVRLKVSPAGETSWADVIRGGVSWRNAEFEDFVILKGDGFPTYNLAAVVDDAAMEISHVVRGDDHISNTPRQILLYQALGYEVPQFAHVPMILGEDGKRLSKRHGASWVGDYREQGYLPEGLLNYLSLLGWSTSESRQTFTLPELIEEFDLTRVGKAAVMFDPEKLRWLNNYHYMELSVAERTERLLPFFERAGFDISSMDRGRLEQVVELMEDRIKVLTDVGLYSEFLFREVTPGEAEEKVLRKAEKVMPVLQKIIEGLSVMDPFEKEGIESLVRTETEAAGVGVGKIVQPIRVAVMGRKVGPGLFEGLALLGRDKTVERLRAAFPS